ncbi:MAG TPA: sn-glycerol-1-phosphate dehydrogenase [Opitutus sp.]|nr:sn-glycerol-1-phosphate dehydrogenase [Opitutus sp.]
MTNPDTARSTGASRPSHFPLSAQRLSLADALASARETKALFVSTGLIARVPTFFREQFSDRTALVVADPASFQAAGRHVVEAFQRSGQPMLPPFVFSDPNLYAEHTFVRQLEEAFRQHDAVPVAVGSGTVNDLVKLAAHRTGRSYLCVATAASMDGYTAFGASITFEGAKQTFDCPAPRAVVADLEVIARAPFAMTASGYADLQAKITAGADWILADMLQVEAIDPRAWEIVQGGLRDALADPAGAREGRLTAIAPLTEGLMLGGFAMQWSRSSRPASGAEHQFSHLWDMEHHTHRGEPPSHGFKVGLATLAVTAFYERLLEQPLEQLDVAACCARWPEPAAVEASVRQQFAANDFLPTALRETLAKHPTRTELANQLERLRAVWPELRGRLRAQLIPSNELKRRLQLVGAPAEPEAIGIDRARLRASFSRAYHIRRRFTVLDLAVRTGLMAPLLDELFGANGIWPVDTAPIP